MKTQIPIAKEGEIVSACIEYLLRRRHFVWRNNTGAQLLESKDSDGVAHSRFFRSGIKGSADIIGISKSYKAGESTGRFIAVECKRPGNKPTPEQLEFLGEIRKRGGYAIVAYSIDDLIKGGL